MNAFMLLMLEFLCLVSFVKHKFQTNKLCAEQWHNDTVFSRVMFEFESLSILNFFFLLIWQNSLMLTNVYFSLGFFLPFGLSFDSCYHKKIKVRCQL